MADACQFKADSSNPAGDLPERVDELVRHATGLRVRESERQHLLHWTGERAHALRRSGVTGAEDYCRLLAEDSGIARIEREMLSAKFTTGESYFFRDQEQFDLLAATILPELIARRASERSLRIWSAGCATGEEPYSLAMLLDEFAPRLSGWNISILGTDINGEALDKARRGYYREWSFRALDMRRRQRYFLPRGDQWQIEPRLREMLSFRAVDLMRDRFPDIDAGLHDFDLILCRNVFIYLDARAVSRITAKFASALADGGYLITGHSELFGHEIAPLRVRMFAQSAVFQKTAQPQAEAGLGELLAKAHTHAFADMTPVAPTARPARRIAPARIAPQAPAAPAPRPAATSEDCDRLMQAAWQRADRGMPKEAAEACRRVIAITDLDPRPYFLLAQLAQERGDWAQAKTMLNTVIYLDPTFIAAHLELGGLHAQDGEDGRARRMYETVRAALAKLPAGTPVAPYSDSTAADILGYVERLLSRPAASGAAGKTGLRQGA